MCCHKCDYAMFNRAPRQPSYFGCHVTYAIDIIENYDKMRIRDVHNVFKKMKDLNKEMFYWNDKYFIDLYKVEQIEHK